MDPKAIIQNFIDIVTKKYFCFDGRTDRKTFWMYILVVFIGNIILNIIPAVGQILSLIWTLGLLCPNLGITARRLHDTGKSGWMQLLALIPIVGIIIVLVLCIPEGDAQANKYGEVDAQ